MLHVPVEPDTLMKPDRGDFIPGERRNSTISTSIKRIVSGSLQDTATWEKVQTTERKRRALLKRTDESSFKILFSYEGTFWKIMIRNALLWVTVSIYMLVRVAFLSAQWSVPPVETSHVGVVGGLITFFLVYFHIQYSNRFNSLYLDSTALQGRIFDISMLAKSSLPQARAVRLIRYMNAAHVMGYVGLSPHVYSIDGFFYQLNIKYQLLTNDELLRLREIGSGSAIYREVLTWCMMEVHDAVQCGLIGDYSSILFQKNIMDFRGRFANMYDMDDQPILFFYIHFIHFLSAVYLPLLAFFVAHQVALYDHWMSDVVGFVAVIFQGIFVIGIRVLAQIMQHPYGGELENLSVLTYIEVACAGSMRILYSQKRPPHDLNVENDLAIGRVSLGGAWEQDVDASLNSDTEDSSVASVSCKSSSEIQQEDLADVSHAC